MPIGTISSWPNYLRLLKAQKNLTWFTVGFGQAAVVFPFILAAPRFFSGAIQLGQLMQIASAFGRVQDSLSWFDDEWRGGRKQRRRCAFRRSARLRKGGSSCSIDRYQRDGA